MIRPDRRALRNPTRVPVLRAAWHGLHTWISTHTAPPGFIAREVLAAARRNAGTAIAIIVTAALSLMMLGGALMVRGQVDDLKGAWYDTTEIAAYLSHDATDHQIATIGDLLDQHPLVAQVWFEDQALAYSNFSQQFADSPDLVAEVTAEQMPESFRIKLHDPATGTDLVQELTDIPGMRQVVDEHAQLASLFDLLHGMQGAALILAGIQALAAVVLISNMVRAALVARARELEIGQVMGATRAQLALPFLTEVGAYGLTGTLGALGLLVVGKAELVDSRLANSGVLADVVGTPRWDAVWATTPWLLTAGVGLPLLVTAVLLRRNLRA